MGKCVCVWKSSKPVNLCLFLGYFSIYFFFIFFFWSNLFRSHEGIGIVVVTNTWNHSCCWCASAVSEFLLLRPSLGSTDSPVAHDGFFSMFVLVAKVCFSTQQRQQENLHGFQFLQGNTSKRQQTTTTEHEDEGDTNSNSCWTQDKTMIQTNHLESVYCVICRNCSLWLRLSSIAGW